MNYAQCINTSCLHYQERREPMVCARCGSSLIVEEQLLPVKLLSQPNNYFSARTTQTFEAVDIATQERVILRVVHSDKTTLVEPLLLAVRALRHIHAVEPHPGIMQLAERYGYFTWQILPNEPPAHFMVTMKVEGENLYDWSRRRHSIVDESLAIKWLKQLIDAVGALHSEGVLHRDIKPENIIVDREQQQLVIIDLDAVCPLGDGLTVIPAEFLPVVGTGLYMAPEQSKGYPRPRSDFYSIGCVVAELITGDSIRKLQAATKEIEWPKKTQVSPQLRSLLEQLTHPNIIYRPTNAAQILSYLEDADRWSAASTTKRDQRQLVRTLVVLIASFAALFIQNAWARQRAMSTARTKTEIAQILSDANRELVSGEPEAAIRLMQQAVAKEPKNAHFISTLAIAQALSGDRTEAIANFEAALEIDPNDPITRYDLANTYEAVDIQEAIENYRLAIKLADVQGNPNVGTKAKNNLARAYLLLNQPQKAIELLNDLADTTDDPFTKAIILKNQAWANYQLDNLATARSQLVRAIDIDPRQTDAFCLKALIQQQVGEDSYNDHVTCLNMYMPETKPEVEEWKTQLEELPGQ